jgi:hypothetical protein
MGTKVKVKTDKPRRGPNKPSGRDRENKAKALNKQGLQTNTH